MHKVNNSPKINKKAYDLLEIDNLTVSGDTITVDWALKGDEENTTSPVRLDQYETWLHSQGYLNGVYDTTDAHGEHVQKATTMSANDYWINTDLTDKYEHMREFLSILPKSQTISINQLKELAQTA